ncbi:MAG: DHH family phosphoesterase [Bacteroidaceae bacterium]|nr:DHH family phosphoesterase [Candidatus Equimonas faecalis]MCQ2205763.1 DHH family phosphoesterase [Bacteroidaceae bacterium]
MLTPLLSDEQLTRLMMLLKGANRCVVCGHTSPDGDALGACLAWTDYLHKLDKTVTLVMPNHCPDYLKWLPGYFQVVHYSDKPTEVEKAFAEADLVCCIDFGEASRVNAMQAALENSPAKRLVIDHHTTPDPAFATAMLISKPEASSSSELVFRLLLQLGSWRSLTRATAACLYCGIMTDTGNLAWSADDPELYQIISMLLRKHINKARIYRNVYYSFSENRLRFTGYLMNEKLKTYHKCKAALFTITREEMERFHFIRGDAEGVVNMPLQIRGMRLSISLREDTENEVVRVSLRSVDDFPCDRMAAEFFNGGGHLNAAGGELPFPLEEAVLTAEKAIDAYKDLL